MNKSKLPHLTSILRILAKKGVYDIFLHIKNQDSLYYNDVLNYAMNNHIIKSRASVTTTLNSLTEYGLLERNVVQDKPVRVCYMVSEKGYKMIRYLKEIEKITKIK